MVSACSVILSGSLVCLCSLTPSLSQAQGRYFIDESFRLPADTSDLVGDTLIVKLVDVDGDGDLDFFLGEGLKVMS